MALNKVPVTGSTVTFTAKGGANTSAEMLCVKGDFDIDFGTFQTTKDICHKLGATYTKGSAPEFGKTTLDGWFTGDKADAFQKLVMDALYNQGDFDDSVAGGNRAGNIKIEFVDQDTTKIDFDVYVTNVKSTFTPDGYLDLKIEVQQITKPTIA
jgi:hypothetical protein